MKEPNKVRPNLDPNTVVTVRNGFNGKLVYISKRTGEKFEWEEFGDEQDMDLSELKAARNSTKAFFANNWFMIDDDEVINYLGVEKYYENSIDYENIDKFLSKSPEKIKDNISKLTDGQKKTLTTFVKNLAAEDKIESYKTIIALEESLNITLIER